MRSYVKVTNFKLWPWYRSGRFCLTNPPELYQGHTLHKCSRTEPTFRTCSDKEREARSNSGAWKHEQREAKRRWQLQCELKRTSEYHWVLSRNSTDYQPCVTHSPFASLRARRRLAIERKHLWVPMSAAEHYWACLCFPFTALLLCCTALLYCYALLHCFAVLPCCFALPRRFTLLHFPLRLHFGVHFAIVGASSWGPF